MVRFVRLEMHSGYIMRRDLKGKMLEAGRLVPFRAPPLGGRQRERTLHRDCSSVCILQKRSWKHRDSVSMLLEAAALCSADAAASKTRNPREPLDFTKATGEPLRIDPPNLLKGLSRGCPESCLCLLHPCLVLRGFVWLSSASQALRPCSANI